METGTKQQNAITPFILPNTFTVKWWGSLYIFCKEIDLLSQRNGLCGSSSTEEKNCVNTSHCVGTSYSVYRTSLCVSNSRFV